MPTLYGYIYEALWLAATPWAHWHLRKRARAGKELAGRLGERFGVTGVARPAGKLVWLHGASVGESVALLPVIAQLRALPEPPTVLLTTGSVTSAALMESRLPAGCLHQFVPLDRARWVRRFLNHWQPDGVIWVESEIWPGLLTAVHARGIPAAFLNVRISAKSAASWARSLDWTRTFLQPFDPVTAVTAADADRWQTLSGRAVDLIANLKFIAAPLACDAEELAVLHGALGNRPVWLMASMHPGEDLIAAAVHRALRAEFPDLLTIIVPRHPQRGTEFAATLRGEKLSVSLRSADETITPQTDIYVADRMGEMGLFYRLAKIVCIGGSFIPHGGQNPIEAAKLGAAILYGPQMFNFSAIAAAFEDAEAVVPMVDAASLAEGVRCLLRDPHSTAVLGQRAQEVCAAEENRVAQIWDLLAPWRVKVGLKG